MSDSELGRDLAELVSALRRLPAAADDSERIDRIRQLEELKAVAAALQVRETAEFVAGQRAEQAAAGVPVSQRGRGIAAQIALARRISPYHAQRYVGWAQVLTADLPRTLEALGRGETNEWRALIVARESAWLSSAHREQVDVEIAPRLPSLGDRRVEGEVKTRAYRLDPFGYVARTRGAEKDRRVGLRPAPDTMCRLTGLLPVAQGVAAYTSLLRAADTCIADGDARSRGQIMADTLVQRLTGQAHADDVPVEIGLVMTDETLLGVKGESDEPAHLVGYGPIPAPVARRLVYGAPDRVPIWLRRLYRHPEAGELISMDSRRRLFSANQRHFVQLRDQSCRTPWCDAPIRHIDHVIPVADGGRTSITNAQGLCAACDFAKQAPGWRTGPADDAGRIRIGTPTGHVYQHAPPEPPGTIRHRSRSPVERALIALLAAA
jgi:5-methylcytosine-specific restriction endonuclease McrA